MDEMSFEKHSHSLKRSRYDNPSKPFNFSLLLLLEPKKKDVNHQAIDWNFVPQTTFSLAGNMNGKISA